MAALARDRSQVIAEHLEHQPAIAGHFELGKVGVGRISLAADRGWQLLFSHVSGFPSEVGRVTGKG